jgi:hypothetical protein
MAGHPDKLQITGAGRYGIGRVNILSSTHDVIAHHPFAIQLSSQVKFLGIHFFFPEFGNKTIFLWKGSWQNPEGHYRQKEKDAGVLEIPEHIKQR